MIRIGTSGWSYSHWEPDLYDIGLPPSQRLPRYVQAFPTVELNSSFYRWPSDASFRSWRRRLPAEFQMSVKAPRGLTHGKKLYDPDPWVQRITRGMHELGDRRGALLVQLAPGQGRDDARLDYFLACLPRWIRVAVELRHASWHDEEVYALLERHNAAYCVMSGAHLPCVLRATADLVYVRLHGPDRQSLYGGSYSDADLAWWAVRLQEWDGQGRDVYLYFNNDGDANAVRNAQSLTSLVRQRTTSG